VITDICCEDQVLRFRVYYVALDFSKCRSNGALNTALLQVCSHFNHHLWREIQESVLRDSHKDKKEVGQYGHVCNLGTYILFKMAPFQLLTISRNSVSTMI
jgi:hypothetical protein